MRLLQEMYADLPLHHPKRVEEPVGRVPIVIGLLRHRYLSQRLRDLLEGSD